MDKIKKFFKKLGPGVITGAADDDPSGITTYALAGAQFGFQFLWTAWLTFPLMTAVQDMCARIGLVTKSGLARVIKTHYPRPLLWLITSLLLIANIFNIGADLAGMAAAIQLLVPIDSVVISLVAAVVIILVVVRLSYRQIVAVFKWLTLALFAYIATYFVVTKDFGQTLRAALAPNLLLLWDPKYLLVLVGILGTSISPYLFFWQTSEEAQEQNLAHRIVTRNELKGEVEDTTLGMLFSQVVMFFIIATTAGALFSTGITNINTAAEAAAALRPLAGDFAYLLFALGIVGTGVLAIPILAGSAAYAVAETFGFTEGLNKPWHKARSFYLVIAVATILGFLLNLIGLSPIKYLLYSAVLNGLIAPILIAVILLIANSKKIMGAYTNGWLSNLLGIITLLIMTGATLALTNSWK